MSPLKPGPRAGIVVIRAWVEPGELADGEDALRARIITVEHSDAVSECSWTAVGIEEVLSVVRDLLTKLTATRSGRE